ncbi:hypothetical protein AXF42_Ash014888 [Apostasia shenzhenica]|uniref:Uncharacterized protein n=1 Tax=Apostasia shenzhenica TaxID=1088818 RepID=A0A2I0ALK0_9ASPA|nr:hypothetical protein AXF42_Ash014888 [Apostasia shenzhenica]
MGTTKRGRKSKHHRLPPRRPLMQHPGAGEPLESEGEGKEVSKGNRGEAKMRLPTMIFEVVGYPCTGTSAP